MCKSKNFTLVAFFLLISVLTALGNLLPHNKVAPLIDHLTEVNKEWTLQTDFEHHTLNMPVSFATDEQRIQLHLRLVEQLLKARTNALCTKEQKTNRQKKLQNLSKYWKRGLFPKNTGHKNQRQPYFIDNYGTACAVGYLIQTSGYHGLTLEISTKNNYAYIEELKNDPALAEWAIKHGFTIDELAWIQPGYGMYFDVYPAVDQDVNVLSEGVGEQTPEINALYTLPDESMMLIGGYFNMSSASGTGKNIAGLAGTELVSFGNSIIGTVHAIGFYNGRIYIGGDFNIENTNYYNIAFWDGTAWQGIQTGPMLGAVYALQAYECYLYAGGDFILVNGIAMSNLAAWSGQVWTQRPFDCGWTYPNSNLNLNGTVKALGVENETKLIVGGHFDLAIGNSLAVDGAVYWLDGWLDSGLSHTGIDSVDCIGFDYDYNGDHVRIGGSELIKYNDQFGAYQNYPLTINAFGPDDSGQFASQNKLFQRSLFIGSFNEPTADGPINAIAHFEGEIYAGGKFESVVSMFTSVVARGLFKATGHGFVPVELSRFDAVLQNRSAVRLDWVTESEINTAHFVIERRTDANADFQAVGEVKAAGESINTINYQFTDKITNVKNTAYYRLKIVDHDGSYEHSKVVAVQLPEREDGLSVYPNPAKEKLNFTLNRENTEHVAFKIYNIEGKLLRTYTPNSNTGELTIDGLPNGIYLLEFTTAQDRFVKKFQILN